MTNKRADHGMKANMATTDSTATAVGVTIVLRLHHIVRRVTVADFPGSWQPERLETRSHDSHSYGARFMLRLDRASETTLQRLVEHFDVPCAAIIRQLLAQATPETFPAGWHLCVAERYGEYARRVRRDVDDEA